jgi:hydrogenase maturation protease
MAAALRERVSSAEATVLAVRQLTPELADTIGEYKRVLFVDASHEGEPGEIRLEPVLRNPNFRLGALAHHLTPSDLAELAYQYSGTDTVAFLLTVTGENFELGEEFSAPVQNSWKPCLERALEWVRTL